MINRLNTQNFINPEDSKRYLRYAGYALGAAAVVTLGIVAYSIFNQSEENFSKETVTPTLELLKNGIVAGQKDLCCIKKITDICQNNLGIPRHDMPQLLTDDVKNSYFSYKMEQGIEILTTSIQALNLTPVQSEINAKVVHDMIESHQNDSFDPCSGELYGPILVSSTNETAINYIIDGHHRFSACRLINGTIDVVMIKDSIHNILKELNFFPGVIKQTLSGM